MPVLSHLTNRPRSLALRQRGGWSREDATAAVVRVVVGFGLAVSAISLGILFHPIVGLIVGCVSLPVLGLYILGVRRAAYDRCANHIAMELLESNTCPCCESTLRATPSPIDGRLLCDTCGSAWDPPAKS